MGLKGRIKSLDDLPEALRAPLKDFYKAGADGTLTLEIEPADGWAFENVAGLRSAVGKEREQREALAAQLKALDGIDPVKAREALGKLQEMANWSPDQKVKEQIEAAIKAASEKHAREIEAVAKDRDGAVSQVERLLVDAAGRAAAAKHKGDADLLLPHIKAQTKVVRDAKGNFVTRIVDESGNTRYSGRAGDVREMDIDELVETSLKARFPAAFSGSGAAGGGATGSAAAGGGGGSFTVTESEAKTMAQPEWERRSAEAAKQGKTLQVVSAH